MSFENTQLLKTGDTVTVFTQPSGQVIRLQICDEHDDLAYTTLNVEELGALIHTLQAASILAGAYAVGEL